jgi:ADP-L-glycero-D-manno-heptose 6-epimerase
MIILTGAGGFIGSVILGYLNSQGINDIIIYDELLDSTQFLNLTGKKFLKFIDSSSMPTDLSEISMVIHFGADSNTLEKDWSKIYKKNVESTRSWHSLCKRFSVPMIFASSAAVYGNGNGPLNQYAFSKNIIEKELDNCCILRLFNVYGPNEYHKGRMASTIFHWYNQSQAKKQITVFENSDNFFRDFIYVEDVARIVHHFIKNFTSGTYDIGTGTAASFQNLAEEFVNSIKNCDIEYKSMPEDLRIQYQTHTCADSNALVKSGFDVKTLITPQIGIKKYIEYLTNYSYY